MATLFVSDAVLSVHLPGGRIDDQTGLVLDLQIVHGGAQQCCDPGHDLARASVESRSSPSAAALEHKDRLTPWGVWQVSLLPRCLLLASRTAASRLTVMEPHRSEDG